MCFLYTLHPKCKLTLTAVQVLRDAAARLGAATAGQVIFNVTTEANAPNLVRVTIDPAVIPLAPPTQAQ